MSNANNGFKHTTFGYGMTYIVLTHDADSVSKPMSHVLRIRSRFRLTDLIAHLLGLTNLYDNFHRIADIEDDVGAKSTFFIPVFLFPLDPVFDELKSLSDEGWEIGLHAVVERIQGDGLIRMQLNYLRDYLGFRPMGVRSHYLICDEWVLSLYANLGFRYDSSIRCETAGRYDPYLIRDSLLELPITLMDADLFGRLHLGEDSAWRFMEWKLKRAINSGSQFIVLLFHQESFRMKGGRLYSKLLWWLHEHEHEFLRCIDAYNVYMSSRAH